MRRKSCSTNTTTQIHTSAPLPVCSVDTYIIVSSRPAWVELHVELPFLAS